MKNELFRKYLDIISEMNDETEYIVYVNGKPSMKYANKFDAEKDIEIILKRYPNTKIEIKVRSYKDKNI